LGSEQIGGRAAVEAEVWMLVRVMAVTDEREEIVDMVLVGLCVRVLR